MTVELQRNFRSAMVFLLLQAGLPILTLTLIQASPTACCGSRVGQPSVPARRSSDSPVTHFVGI